MTTRNDYPPNWAVLSGASVTAELVPDANWTSKPVIEIWGNREGMLALGNLLAWVSSAAADTESLSITGLPFVHAKSSLSLTVVQPMRRSDTSGTLVRMDKGKQFRWLIHDDVLRQEALNILDIAFCPDGYCCEHFHVRTEPPSECDLLFARNDMGQYTG